MTTAIKQQTRGETRRFEIPSPDKSATLEGRQKDNYRLEWWAHFILRTGIISALLALFYYQTEFLAPSFPFWSALFATITIQRISLFRLPSLDLVPVRKQRADWESYLKKEFRFALILTTAFFFAGVTASPAIMALFIGANFICQTVLFTGWRAYNLHAAKRTGIGNAQKFDKQVIIVGASWRGKRAADIILEHPDLKVNILGFIDDNKNGLWRYRDIPLLGHSDELVSIIASNHVDYVFMAPEPEDYIKSQMVFSVVEKMGIDICVMPDIYQQNIGSCRASAINGQPLLLYHTARQDAFDLFLKDLLDRLGGIAGLLLTGPVLILAAIAIKLDSRGPVFFRQERSGKNGLKFEMLKLRTMVADAEKKKKALQHLNEMSGPVFKIKDDPRITRVGKILRKFSIDEFPQFINIARGEMSLVGPRPPLPKEVAEYEPWQRRKLSVRPGATCLWQISGRNNVDFEEWMKLDLKYIDNWSIREDTKILLKTIPAVLKGSGAS